MGGAPGGGHASSTAPPRAPAGATQDDLRAVRRWLVVAGVWAVSATAVALIALLDTSGDDARQAAGRADERAVSVERGQRRLGRRVDELESRLDGLAPVSDLARLGDRLDRAEDAATEAGSSARDADEQLADLADRVERVEREAGVPDGASGSARGGGLGEP